LEESDSKAAGLTGLAEVRFRLVVGLLGDRVFSHSATLPSADAPYYGDFA
jgi:hypothetical protein